MVIKKNRGKQKVYSADEIDEKLEKINAREVPTKTSDLTNDSGFITSESLPTKTSQLTNDSSFLTGLKISSITTTGHYAVEHYFNPQAVLETDVTYTNAGYYPISVSATCDGVRLEQLYIVSGGLGTATIHFRMFNTSAGTAYIGKLTILVTWAK